MRNTLIVLRGLPGCGKSTWVKEHGLEKCVLSTDDLRVQFMLTDNKSLNEIEQKYDGPMFSMFYKQLELWMEYKLLVVVDATHLTTSSIAKYHKYVKKYNYRTIVVDFTFIPVEECKKRNAARESYKVVPEEVIDRMVEDMNTSIIPTWVDKVIKFDEDMVF